MSHYLWDLIGYGKCSPKLVLLNNLFYIKWCVQSLKIHRHLLLIIRLWQINCRLDKLLNNKIEHMHVICKFYSILIFQCCKCFGNTKGRICHAIKQGFLTFLMSGPKFYRPKWPRAHLNISTVLVYWFHPWFDLYSITKWNPLAV